MALVLFGVLVLACYGILYVAATRGREILLITLAFLTTISFFFATKIVAVAGYPLVPSAPIMAVLFYSGAILQEYFGPRQARRLLLINLGTMLGLTGLMTLARWMALYSPLPADQMLLGQSFDRIATFLPQALYAAIGAFTTAYALNVVLGKTLHKLCGDRFFALRSFATVSVSNLLDISAFVILAYGWSDAALAMIFTTWMMRLICILAGIPVIWAIKRSYARQGMAPLSVA